jgi:hypothetical protein
MMAIRVWRLAIRVWRRIAEQSGSNGRAVLAWRVPRRTSFWLDRGLTFQVGHPFRETPNAKRETRNVL